MFALLFAFDVKSIKPKVLPQCCNKVININAFSDVYNLSIFV